MPDESGPGPGGYIVLLTPNQEVTSNLSLEGWTVNCDPQLIKHCLVINDWNYEEEMCAYGNKPQKDFFLYGKKEALLFQVRAPNLKSSVSFPSLPMSGSYPREHPCFRSRKSQILIFKTDSWDFIGCPVDKTLSP